MDKEVKKEINFVNKKGSRGFTLIELLVVVAIIGILASVVIASLNSARAKARDTKRKQDMTQLRSALELYYSNNGSYPLQNPSSGFWGGVNANLCGSGSASGTASGAGAYITGLTPVYISVLPVDPTTVGQCSGYLYHSDGTNYKILSYQVYEEAYPSAGQPFYDDNPRTHAIALCNSAVGCVF